MSIYDIARLTSEDGSAVVLPVLSEDGGETFSDIYELPYSKESLYDGVNVMHMWLRIE